MAELSFMERRDIEGALEMGGGYVLDFSNNTFSDFVADSVRIDIYGGKYSDRGSSKANHLREFIAKAPNHMVGKLLYDLIAYARVRADNLAYPGVEEKDIKRFDRCVGIAERLRRDQVVENVDALQPNIDDEDFTLLAQSVRDSIEQNKPQLGLDRLHTFCVKYFRNLCIKRKVDFIKDDTLGNLVGKYVKKLEAERIIQTKLTIQIMKSSITTFSDLNYVRNNQSFAHDNIILNYEESLLVFNNVANTIRFIQYLESTEDKKAKATASTPSDDLDDEIPF